MRSANLIFSISKVRADSVQYIRHAAGSWSVIVETQRGCVHQVLKRRARACFESTPCTRAEMIRALRNAVDWSLQATTRCTAKTLEYCNNAWVEPTLRMGKHGPLSLLASFGDLEVYLPMRCSHFFPLWECLNVVFGMNRSCCAARCFRLQGIQWVRKRIMGMAAYSRDVMSKPLVAVGLMKPFKDLEGHEWSQKNVQGVHEIFKVKEV